MAKLQSGGRISNYLLLEPIGRGTFGEVWKARHHVWADQLVAIKVPTDEQYVRNLQKEGMVVHGLVHPNIVRVIDLDPFADIPYLIMEFVDGRSLKDLLAERKRLDVETAADYLKQILMGLNSAHTNGIIHRDIKPANILITPEGTVKVVDFGLGRVAAVTTQSLLISGNLQTFEGKSISGTLAYMAPEQQEPTTEAGAGAPADLYAAGIVFYEMLTGTRPQGMDAPSDVVPELPKWVDEVFRRAYTRLERRYASAQHMLDAMENARKPAPAGGNGEASAGSSTVNALAGSDGDILIISDDTIPRCPTGPVDCPSGDEAVVFVDDTPSRPNLEKGPASPTAPAPAAGMLWIDDQGRSGTGARTGPASNPPRNRRDPEPVVWLNEPPATPPRRPAARPPTRPPARTDAREAGVWPLPPPAAKSAAAVPIGPAVRHCPSCSHLVAAADNFCMKCGRQMVGQIRRCDRCGGYPSADDEFCIFCGHELGVLRIR